MKTTRHESAEDYLETILVLSKQLPVVRAVDIANELNYKKSSVSVAMKNLRNAEQITVSDAGYITLTEEGKRIAEMIYSRHQFFLKWLISLGIDEELATEDACSMEHDMSETTFQAIKSFVSKHSSLDL
jgi:DtxR family transcriptional regulator, Mn-dependent transcriptional regulator